MIDDPIDLDLAYHVDELREDSLRISAAARWIVEQFGLRELSASIAVVDDPTIHELNRQHLDHDWPTDVISFVFSSLEGVVDGEVIASADTARRLSTVAGWSAEDELLLYIVHGLLHLAGLDDIQAEERQQMRLAEMRCLQALGIDYTLEHIHRWDELST